MWKVYTTEVIFIEKVLVNELANTFMHGCNFHIGKCAETLPHVTLLLLHDRPNFCSHMIQFWQLMYK